MLDGWGRRQIDPALDRAARALASAGIGANAVTLASFALGMAAAACIAFGQLWAALALILLSRIGDGLDGAVARVRGAASDLGGYLDIVLDFAFYGAVPVAFALYDPGANAVAASVLVLAFYVNGASFLAFAAIAGRRGMTTEARGPKSLFFTTGLAEAGETLAVFVAWCLAPQWFAPIAYGFAAVTAWTTVSRLVLARSAFR